MTNLAVITRARLVEDRRSQTVPGGEAIPVGVPCRIDGTTGKAMIGNATDPTEADVVGINITPNLTLANVPAHLVCAGQLALYDTTGANILAGMNYDAKVFLSATDGRFADANPGVNEVQTLTITGTPTGGTFTLTFGGQTTGTIAYNATAATVQAALEALSTIRKGNVICAGGALPGTAVTIEFVQELGNTNQPLITGTFTGLTGGSSPDGSIAQTTAGVQSKEIGRVVPLWDQEPPTKLLDFDLR